MTWVPQPKAGTRNWGDVACDSTCTTMMAADYGGNIYVSDDSGSTWAAQSQAGSHEWNAIAMSTDGTKLVAAEFGGTVWTSILEVDAAQASRRYTLRCYPPRCAPRAVIGSTGPKETAYSSSTAVDGSWGSRWIKSARCVI